MLIIQNLVSTGKNLLKMDGKLYIKLLKIINGIQDDSAVWS